MWLVYSLSDKSLSDKSLSDKSLSDKSLSDKSLSDKSLSDKSLSDKSLSDKSLSDKSLSERSLSDKFVLSRGGLGGLDLVERPARWRWNSGEICYVLNCGRGCSAVSGVLQIPLHFKNLIYPGYQRGYPKKNLDIGYVPSSLRDIKLLFF